MRRGKELQHPRGLTSGDKRSTAVSRMKRLGQPDEVAEAFIYLASADVSYCNGTPLILDGGALC